MCDVYSVLQTDQITLGVWPNNLAKSVSKLFFLLLFFFLYSENNLSINIYFLHGIIRFLIEKKWCWDEMSGATYFKEILTEAGGKHFRSQDWIFIYFGNLQKTKPFI